MLQVFEKFVMEIDLFRSNVLGYGLVTVFVGGYMAVYYAFFLPIVYVWNMTQWGI